MEKTKVVFMGTPEFSVPILQMLIDKYNVVGVVTQPDRKVGRKQEIKYSPVKEFALENGIEVFQPEKIKDDYLEERYDDKERYKENNKRLAKINLEIFKRGNSIKDAVKDAGKSIVSGTAIMVAAKAILAIVAPGTFSLTDFRSLLIPFMFLVINGIIDIPTYVNKLKYRETDYEGKVSVHELERIKKIIEIKKQEMGMENYQTQPSFV